MPGNTVVSIYIAKGDDTLGPYTPGEAAELIKTGRLLPGDLAARNGDTAWVPLSILLPGETPTRAPEIPRASATGRHPWHRRSLAGILAVVVVAFLVGEVPRVVRSRVKTLPLRVAKPVPPLPPVAEVKPAVDTPGPPPMNEKGVRLSGTIRLISPDGTPTALPTVQVRAYPLPELVLYLEKRKVAVQAELDRLAPLIAAAESEKAITLVAERDARLALLDAVPGSDLEPSLQFNYDQSQAAAKNAKTDCRYLLDQRAEASRGDAYFRELPVAAITTNTNPEGEFFLDLPPGGAFAVAASVPQAARTRYWLVKVTAEGEDLKTVVLSDDNEASHDSPESLIQTTL